MSDIQTKFKTTKGKEFDVAEAFPMTLGFVEDLMAAGININDLGAKDSKGKAKPLPTDQSFALFKVTLRQCGLSDAEARQVSTSDMGPISKAIQHFMDKAEVESQGRPT